MGIGIDRDAAVIASALLRRANALVEEARSTLQKANLGHSSWKLGSVESLLLEAAAGLDEVSGTTPD